MGCPSGMAPMRLASHKLPIKCKFVTKAQQEAEAAAQEKGGEA